MVCYLVKRVGMMCKAPKSTEDKFRRKWESQSKPLTYPSYVTNPRPAAAALAGSDQGKRLDK